MSIIDNIQNIPEDLRQHGLFCCWAYQDRPGSAKPAKVPYSPKTGERARVDHPEDFAPLDEAMAAFQSSSYSGIGILITGNLCAIDIDGCIEDNGQLSPMAADVVNQMQTYTEISPSGKGLRLLFPINQPIDRDTYYVNNPDCHMEVYTNSTKKYVTLTGNVIIPARQIEGRSPEAPAKACPRPTQHQRRNGSPPPARPAASPAPRYAGTAGTASPAGNAGPAGSLQSHRRKERLRVHCPHEWRYNSL